MALSPPVFDVAAADGRAPERACHTLPVRSEMTHPSSTEPQERACSSSKQPRNLQGVRDTDYHWANSGELVYLPALDCSSPHCGCILGFAGFESRRATTTARVVERPDLTVEDLCRKLAESLHAGGWIPTVDPSDGLVVELATEIVELALRFGRFGPGAVIERDGEMVVHRLPRGVEAIDVCALGL